MNPDQPRNPGELFEELASGAALDALSAEELRLWETVRATRKNDPLPGKLQDVAAALAFTLPQKKPPGRCRDAVLGAIARRAVPTESVATARPGGGFSFDSVLPWAAAAIFAFASTFMAVGLAKQKGELAKLRSETFGPLQVRKALLTPSDPNLAAVARLAFCSNVQQGRLVVEDLPPCPSGKGYQLWIVPHGSETPISVAFFRVDESRHAAIDFKPDVPLDGVMRAMISLENSGGARSPSGPVLLAGQ